MCESLIGPTSPSIFGSPINLNFTHLSGFVVVYLCDISLHFSNESQCWESFHVFTGHSCPPLWCGCQVVCPFLIYSLTSYYWVVKILCILWTQVLWSNVYMCDLNISVCVCVCSIYSEYVACIFSFSMVSLDDQKFSILMKSNLSFKIFWC